MSQSDFKTVIKLLAMGDLLDSFSKVQGEVRYITECQLNKNQDNISDHDAIEGLMNELNIKDRKNLLAWQQTHILSNDSVSLIEYARFRYKRRSIIDELISNNGQALFLRYKDRLDRVLYSLIRVDDEDKAYHLYYQIESGELQFGDAASDNSLGPEAKTQGIVGPCDLTVPHPDIASRLRTANPRQIFSPFQIDQWFAILKLEYRFDSEYNENTKRFLGQLLLNTKVQSISNEIFQGYTDNFSV